MDGWGWGADWELGKGEGGGVGWGVINTKHTLIKKHLAILLKAVRRLRNTVNGKRND